MQASPIVSDKSGRRRGLIALALLLMVFQAGAVLHALMIPGDVAAQISLLRPLELAASAVWVVVSALVALALLRRHPRAARFSAWLVTGFLIYSVGRLAVFARADYDRERLPFLAAVTAAAIILAVYLLRFRLVER